LANRRKKEREREREKGRKEKAFVAGAQRMGGGRGCLR